MGRERGGFGFGLGLFVFGGFLLLAEGMRGLVFLARIVLEDFTLVTNLF
jgi:hypothetical protein